MSPEDLGVIRVGAELQNMKPYLDNEIEGMQSAIVNSVLVAVNNGSLSPEMALSKWMEYIAYKKLSQKFSQRIEIGKSTGGGLGQTLDFQSKVK